MSNFYSSGVDPNKPCVFPFIYMDETINTCTTIDGDTKVCQLVLGYQNSNVSTVKFEKSLSHIQAWCSTAVDENAVQKGFWGYCEAGCPGCKTETCPVSSTTTTSTDCKTVG